VSRPTSRGGRPSTGGGGGKGSGSCTGLSNWTGTAGENGRLEIAVRDLEMPKVCVCFLCDDADTKRAV